MLALATLVSCAKDSSNTSPRKIPALSSNGLAPGSLAGFQLKSADNHGRNIYTFFPGGRYRFAWLSQNESLADSREGRFDYSITSPNEALLGFEDEPPITLRFFKPGLATGTIQGDLRTYQFQLVPFDAE